VAAAECHQSGHGHGHDRVYDYNHADLLCL